MLISHSHKFVTIDIQKTGTRTMRETLKPLGIIDVIGGRHSKFNQHGTALEAKQGFSNMRENHDDLDWNWDDYFKYSIVRNPWKRYVSFVVYRLGKARLFNKATEEEKSSWVPQVLNQGKACSMWANEFQTDKERLISAMQIINTQQQMLCDEHGQCMVDMLGETNHFAQSFEDFCNAVGIGPVPEINHGNKGAYKRHYTDYYDQETTDMVEQKEWWVIETKGYKFSS